MTKGDVWVYSESDSVSNEVASAAAEVAGSISGEAVVLEVGESRDSVFTPSRKILIEGPPNEGLIPEVTAEAIGRAAKVSPPAVILLGATRDGREIGSRLSVKLGMGCLSDVFKLEVEGKALVADRYAFAGRVVAKVIADMPCIATVKVGSYPKMDTGTGDVQMVKVGAVESKTKRISVAKKEVGTVDLRSAKVIVSAGRGVKKREDLVMIESLAAALGGAVGCSRPLSSDLGWLPEEHHIGLTGVTVKPELYLAVGISGQLQHVAGIKDSKVIAAINSDKEAPIFQAADYGIVGDLYQVVPEIRKALEKRSR